MECRIITPQEEEIAWNIWRSNLQNKIMQDVRLPIIPNGITFKFTFCTGQAFIIKDYSNSIFRLVLDKFLKEQNMEQTVIKAAMYNGNKIDMNQTLLNNKITNNSNVLLYTPKIIKTLSTPNLFNNNFKNINYNNNLNNNINNNNINYLSTKNVPIYNYNPLNTFYNPNPINYQLNLNNNINNNINSNLQREINILINGCNVPPNIFDSRGDCVNSWDTGRKNGPPGFLKDYIPPIGWTGIGLKVLNLYDNGDNTWLGTTNKVGEWYIAYHGIKTINSISGIINNGFRRGPFQLFKNERNVNPLNNNIYPICGEGVYFLPDFNDVKQNAYVLTYSEIKFRVIFMCRINPYKVKICRYIDNKEAWIVNGDRLNDIEGKKYDDEVRLYRILIYIENN